MLDTKQLMGYAIPVAVGIGFCMPLFVGTVVSIGEMMAGEDVQGEMAVGVGPVPPEPGEAGTERVPQAPEAVQPAGEDAANDTAIENTADIEETAE